MKVNKNIHIDFLKSSLAIEGCFHSLEEFFLWFNGRKQEVRQNIQKIPFSELINWCFEKNSDNLVHSSGKFFSIEGIHVHTNWGVKTNWSQPIINQPEVGYLGIITKKINGTLHFLMQAKIEPGNINGVQLSPTLQATRSNYTKVHGGNPPAYLEYFRQKGNKRVLIDQLQSEQGARFIKKRNRNIIIEVEEDLEVFEDFFWLTLGQIKQLLLHDNVINMDTRTVISCIPYGSYNEQVFNFYRTINNLESFESGLLLSAIEKNNHLYEIEEIISWLTNLKSIYFLEVEKIPLKNVEGWHKNEVEIYQEDQLFFKVIAVRAEIQNREVTTWTQPLVESAQEGIIAFITKKFGNIIHFLVQAKLEAGNLDIIELAPTVQCLTGNYKKVPSPPFLDYVLTAKEKQIKYDTFQSEEGGRFYREQNRNMIIEVDDSFDLAIPENYIWMTLNQMNTFIKFNNYFNIQARSLLAAIKFFGNE